MIGLLGYAPFAVLPPVAVANGLPEAGVATLIVVVVVAAWLRIQVGRKKGASI